MIPMMMFHKIIGKKVRLRNDPTMHKSTVITRKIKLKYVKVLLKMICLTVSPVEASD